jgi:LytS/YehU family sensor histidine kinase
MARRQYKKNLEKININRRFAELQLNALQSQMNPHFIFNSMNTLQYYILQNDTLNANEYLSKYSLLLRSFLQASRSRVVSIQDEIELLELYIELENKRQENAFLWNLDVHPQVKKETMIPSVIIQPFVENAIQHGLRHLKDREGMLQISFLEKEDAVCCIIDDNGIGRTLSKEINERKKKLYPSHGINLVAEKIKTLKSIENINIEILTEDKVSETGEALGTRVTILFKI